jgi:hypothetical protein
MLDLKVTVEGDKVVIAGLNKIADEMPNAIKRGLKRVAAGIYAIAYQWLSGAGGQTKSYTREWSAGGGEVRSKKTYGAAPGGYPVPVRSGNLRRLLDWLNPGETKSGDIGTFTAEDNEVVIFDSASYASDIFLGKGSSAAYGPRDAVSDAFQMFNRGAMIETVMGEEIQKEINAAL